MGLISRVSRRTYRLYIMGNNHSTQIPTNQPKSHNILDFDTNDNVHIEDPSIRPVITIKVPEDKRLKSNENSTSNEKYFKTADSWARDYGVVTADKTDEFNPEEEECLQSVIRWQLDKPKKSKHHIIQHHHQHSIPKTVELISSIDNWQKRIPLNRSTDDFVGLLKLPLGKHKYKFIVDGEEQVNLHDDNEKDPYTGDHYNVINIEKSDFHIFNALDDDNRENDRNNHLVNKNKSTNVSEVIKNPENMNPDELVLLTKEIMDADYSQNIPDKAVLRANKDKKMAPAELPPHLLQKILLNEQVHSSYEPSLLPEPQHVMLNHLYALAIKNGVMALSATGRYKRKFVTTLLYKPLNDG